MNFHNDNIFQSFPFFKLKDKISNIEWLLCINQVYEKHSNKHLPKQKDYYLRTNSATKSLNVNFPNQINYRDRRSANISSSILRETAIKEKNKNVLKKCLKEKNQSSLNIINNLGKLTNPVYSSKEIETKSLSHFSMDVKDNSCSNHSCCQGKFFTVIST